MAEGSSPPPSIRRRLLVFLSAALLVLIVGAGTVTYWVALRAANDAYDRSLLDPVLDIADYIRIDSTGRASTCRRRRSRCSSTITSIR